MSLTQRAWNAVPESIRNDDTRMIVALLVSLSVLYALIGAAQAVLANAAVVNAAAQTVQSVIFLSGVYAILALALNLHWGYTGLFNIGVAGFMAVGVYTMSILAGDPNGLPPGLGLPVPVAIVGGVVMAAIVGGIAALPALQLDADYFAIVTVGFSEIIRLTLTADTFSGTVTDPSSGSYNVVNIFGLSFGTGGGRGITTALNSPLNFLFEGPLSFIGETLIAVGGAIGISGPVVQAMTYTAFILVVVLTGYYALVSRIGNSPFGRVLKAIREDELVAQSLGKDTRIFKIKVFMVGSAMMGLAGILWQGTRGYVNPNTFKPLITFYVFTALIVGGSGSNTGSVVGGAVFASLLLQGPRRLAGLINALAQFITGGSLPAPSNFWVALTSLDPAAYLGYAIANMPNLRFIFLGVVLVYLIQNRSQGLLGHRKEIASSIDLSKRTDGEETDTFGGRPATDGGNGGETDE
ncbi:branched-chain amino acid ABC transporter permease [Halorarius halobius]|uniref:branched-chain amino acid ABC transporter permease n=1 Tax=Halorarius halobius TaxID=2962671 RepID=UPI0020CE0502|nr:branched-chain amino acid ABC transporter permease [Halorarius halobius]